MGQRKLADKTISPLQVLYNLTPLLATEGRSRGSLGTMPIGNFKDDAAFFDLDMLANQPLVRAEQL